MTKVTRIGALIVAGERDMARAEVLAALDAAKGNRTHAAESLGVSAVAFRRWIAELDMWDAVDALCERKGYHVQPGPQRARPRKTRRSTAKRA